MRQKLIAEGLGTFMLVFCGTGAIIIDHISQGSITHMGIALTFGLIIMVLIYSLGHISGAHFNPAVSIGFYASGRFPGKEVLPYIIAQLIGAISASLVLKLLFPSSLSMGETLPADGIMQTFVLEIILTFLLMLVIMQVSTGPKEIGTHAALAIGGTVGLEALFAGPITGASMNPARSIAPAIMQANLDHLWIYIAAPILGALLAIWVWRMMHSSLADN